jgi:hypothetical protein
MTAIAQQRVIYEGKMNPKKAYGILKRKTTL